MLPLAFVATIRMTDLALYIAEHSGYDQTRVVIVGSGFGGNQPSSATDT
jgi:hypothetical protein